MAKVIMCDRCGEIYKDKIKANVVIMAKNKDDNLANVDLCSKCIGELEEWLKNNVYFIGFNDKKIVALPDEPEPGTMGEYINRALYDMPLEKMGLSTRLWNILARGLYELDSKKFADKYEIKVKDLCNLKIKDVQGFRNMGAISWKELLIALSKEAADEPEQTEE